MKTIKLHGFSLAIGLTTLFVTLLLSLALGMNVVLADAPILNENFDYGSTAGDLTTQSGGNWSAHSGAGDGPVQYDTSSLSMTGYVSSDIGGSATFGSGSEDVNRTFTEQTSGTVYYAALVNLSTASSGTYFLHLKDNGFNYRGRVFAQDVSGNLRFGFHSSSSTAMYSSTDFSYNTTYLIVVKYNVSTGDGALFVLDTPSASEPASPLVSSTGDAGSVLAVAIRQGSGGPTGTIDGIRVATTWNDAVGIPAFAISKSAPAMVSPDEVFTYTIVVANSTGISTTGTVITDVVPADADFASASDGGILVGNTVQWAVTGNFTAGLTLTRTFQVTATSASGVDIVNDAYGVRATNWTTPAYGNPVTTTVSPLDLIVNKTGPEYAILGENIVYTITLHNTGVATATNVVLTDTLPLTSTYVSDDSPWACAACMIGASGVITWDVGDVPSNTLHSFNLTVTAGVPPLGTLALPLVNRVQVSTDTSGDDPSNNSDQWETTAYPHVSIYDIQHVDDPATDGDSPFRNQVVCTEGIVVANYGDQVFIQDGAGAWNGVMLYRPDGTLNVGDQVQVCGSVIEYYGMTEFASGADTTIISSGNALPASALVTAADILYDDASVSEQYEAVLVETHNITVTAIESYGIWAFTDASGGTGKADDWAYAPDPAVGDVFARLRGPLVYDYNEYKVMPRDADDALQGDIIVIEKTAPASVALGGVFTYTLTVANRKGFDLNDVLITDAVPDSTTFAYALDGGAEAGGVVSWSVPSLASLDEISVRFVVTAASSSALIVNDDYAVSASNYVTPTFGEAVNTVIGELRIYHLQGEGDVSPYLGQQATVQGVVVADLQASTELEGFFMQDATGDGNPLTSDGIFVYATQVVSAGDWVEVTGLVDEHYGLTQLDTVSAISVISSGNSIAATPVTLPEETNGDLERYEGMLVTIPHTMTVVQNYFQGRYGQLTLAAGGRLYQPTHVYAPGSPAAIDLADENARRLLVLDDGSDDQNVSPIPYIGADNTLRAGDVVSAGLTGVLDYGRINSDTPAANDYRLHPTGAVHITRVNARSAAPDDVGGRLQVASFNVLNYFNGDGQGGGFPTPRGANTPEEFVRQRTKIISAVLALDADVIGLMEIENDGYDTYSAIQDLVNGLNAIAGAGTYAFIDPGVPQIGTDEIAVGLLYRPGTVSPVGPAALLDSTFDPAFIDTLNRPALAQTFEENATHARFTAAVNHLKSKGSACDDVGDPDTGDGQGNCNLTRTDAMTVEISWLATDPTDSGDPDFMIFGDLNSYAMEDPIAAARDAGYTDLLQDFVGVGAYSYIFDGQSGYLDHALANASLAAQVTGATDWHINSDEPAVIDYNMENKPQDLYAPDPYRASDHDPLVVGLDLVDQTALTVTKDVSPSVDVPLGATVIYTITIANDGAADALGVVVTDELPSELTFGGYLSNPGGTAQLPGLDGVITWESPVGSGMDYTLVFSATVTTDTLAYGTDVTNVVHFTSTNAGSGSDGATLSVEQGYAYVYLPLVMRMP
jgi:uncharacterized repeat protein (TIGR01451 family)